MVNDVGIVGIEFDYPEHKYSTQKLFDILGNKISDRVKNNISQLGVENRYFVKPIEHYLINSESTHPADDNHAEPISDLAAQVAQKCLTNLGLNFDDITCLVAASENNDYQSPGLSSILIKKIGLSNYVPHFNLQGMACSSFPKVLELGKNLVHNDNDKVLIVISGCNSGWYLPHLKDDMFVRNPKEIGESQYDGDRQLKKWVSTMFSFLFGDGVVALVLSKEKLSGNKINIGKITHAVNFDKFDYRKACVQLRGQYDTHHYEYELSAGYNVIEMATNYSQKVLMKHIGKSHDSFDEVDAKSFMSKLDKVMIHTGSMKILDKFKDLYDLQDAQLQASYDTLRDYGNLTGCSIPTVMRKAFLNSNSGNPNGLLVGITMGFGLDIVEVERV
jgi:3-oxoacyl-[acyl-carrier-protein] synthase III